VLAIIGFKFKLIPIDSTKFNIIWIIRFIIRLYFGY